MRRLAALAAAINHREPPVLWYNGPKPIYSLTLDLVDPPASPKHTYQASGEISRHEMSLQLPSINFHSVDEGL